MACRVGAALIPLSSAAYAAEPGPARVPPAVAALDGCWQGKGEVMGKPVTVAIVAKPIVLGAMLALDVESSAIADPADRYSAHLLFGGADRQPGTAADRISGFWADSFGGAFTATGQGESRPDGFDIAYQYPGEAFINRWRPAGGSLGWRIVSRDSEGTEKPFASYSLRKAACRIVKAAG